LSPNGLEAALPSKRIINVLIWTGCFAVLGLISWRSAVIFESLNRSDPDRYYHFAVSDVTARDFAPETLPQITGIGWDKFFVEKEFGFHVLTGLGSRLGGDTGVVVTAMLIGAAIIFVVFLVNTRRVGPLLALLATVLVLTASDRFLIRSFTVRPHVLANLIAISLVWALIEQRPRMAALFGAMFALSYHAIYLPVFYCGTTILAAALLGRFKKTPLLRSTMRCTLATAAGIAVGVLANPYFPSNIMVGLQHLRILLKSSGLPMSHFGSELVPWTGVDLLGALLGVMLLVVAGIFAAGAISSRLRQDSDQNLPASAPGFEALTLLLICGSLLGLSFHSIRAIEFLMPAASLLMVRLALLTPRPKTVLSAATVLFFALQYPANKSFYVIHADAGEFLKPGHWVETAKAAVERIPVDPAAANVANCRFDVSPHLFHVRRDLKFIDILDPTFLFSRNPDAYRMRQAWVEGMEPDPWGVLKSTFGSDYVFCWAKDAAIVPLQKDPHFVTVFPSTVDEQIGAEFSVLALSPQRRPEFVTGLQHGAFTSYAYESFRSADPAELTTGTPWEHNLTDSAFRPVFFRQAPPKPAAEAGPTDMSCVSIVPTASELTRLAGSDIVGLGGGPYLELWVDEKLAYSDDRFAGAKTIVHTLVPLTQPVTPSTSLRVRACFPTRVADYGVAVSLWTQAALKEICARKSADPHSTECFASYAPAKI
jgi:hypothetical protein